MVALFLITLNTASMIGQLSEQELIQHYTAELGNRGDENGDAAAPCATWYMTYSSGRFFEAESAINPGSRFR